MNLVQTIKVPTGKIFVVESGGRKSEFLSIGDYGQSVNLNQNKPVPSGLPIAPLTEKWVITLSTQYGCDMGCKFCDVPKVGRGVNITKSGLLNMIQIAMYQPESPLWTNRLNIHFARMGEPTFNRSVLEAAVDIIRTYGEKFNPHPVVSTMMPNKNKRLKWFLDEWMNIKNVIYRGNAGLQLSINSTDEDERNEMFNSNSLSLYEISEMVKDYRPVGRKITLNFAVADYTVDCDLLSKLFNPDHFIVKLTPMHKTEACEDNRIKTKGDYTSNVPYQELEARFKKAGFETLVFIASKDEDDSRITCGNAILSGNMPKCNYSVEFE